MHNSPLPSDTPLLTELETKIFDSHFILAADAAAGHSCHLKTAVTDLCKLDYCHYLTYSSEVTASPEADSCTVSQEISCYL